MIMKNIIIILVTALIVGCTLEETNYNSFSTDEYFQNEDQIFTAIVGVYEPLRGLTNNAQYMGNVGTDESRTYSGSDYGEALDSYNYDNANTFLVAMWTQLYSGVNRANSVIEGIEASSVSDELKTPYIAEAKFLRGIYYYYLVRYWGEVPLRLSSSSSYDSSFEPLDSISDIYDAIISDFTDAAAGLPTTQSLTGRATQGAAYSFLASAYLSVTGYPLYRSSQSDYQNVVDAAQAVIDLDIYSLLDNYSEVFDTENHAESIFEYQAGWVTGTGGAVKTYMGVVGTFPVVQHQDNPDYNYPDVRVGSANIRPVTKFAMSFEDGDTRYENNIADYVLTGYNASGTRITLNTNAPTIVEVRKEDLSIGDYTDMSIAKFKFPEGTDVTLFTQTDNPLNFCLMRYSEVLLTMAEAQYHIGGYAASQPYFDQVSSRAGATTWDGTGDIDERILMERGWELCFECKRFFDLQRLNKLYTKVTERDSEYAPSDYTSFQVAEISESFRYYTIPQVEYDYNLEL